MRLLRRRGDRPRRSTCSSRGLAIPARVRADAAQRGWMVVDELARRHDGSFRSKFDGQLAEIRLDGLRLALIKPETYMNVSGQLDSAAQGVLQGRAGVAARRPRRRRPRAGAFAGAAGWRARRPQRAALDRLRARHAGFPAAANRSRPSGARRPAAGRRLRPVGFRPSGGRGGAVSRAADAVETIASEGLEPAQQRFN